MKRILLSAVLAAICSLFVSCFNADSPSNYTTQIEDATKFNICELDFFRDQINEASSDSEVDYIIDEWCDFEDLLEGIFLKYSHNGSETAFYDALLEVSQDPSSRYSQIASGVLSYYYKETVALSEFEQAKTSGSAKLWYYKELRSGLQFSFAIDDDGWLVDIDEDDCVDYIMG